MVLAKRTHPPWSFGSSLKMFGYLDFGLGTEEVVGTFGTGGGRGAMLIPLSPGMVAPEQFVLAVGMASKLQGTLLTAGTVCLGGLNFFSFLSFFTFLCLSFFLFQLDLELSDLLSDSLSLESELYLSFFFFLSSLSLFLSFFFSRLSRFRFLSPITIIIQPIPRQYYSLYIHGRIINIFFEGKGINDQMMAEGLSQDSVEYNTNHNQSQTILLLPLGSWFNIVLLSSQVI